MTKKRVLLIEDDGDIRNIVRWILEGEGYEVYVTPHVLLEQIVSFKADLILLDEWINNKEGHMLCKDIKKVKELKHLPVVIFSTAVDIESIVKTCGANGYVRKPFDIDELTNTVNNLLSNSAPKVFTEA